MDHDDEMLGTVMSRREAMGATAAAGVSLLFGRSGAPGGARLVRGVNLVATPEVEEGPFFVDEELHRSDVTLGATRTTVAQGSPIAVRLTVYALQGARAEPLRDAHVDIWHADAKGTYSDEPAGDIQHESTKGEKWLRGYQITGADGTAEFRTIYPGWYESRTPHIHVKIRRFHAGTNKTHVFNTQLFFDEAENDKMLDRAPYSDRGYRRVRNVWDGLYAMKQADGTMLGSHLHFTVDKSPDGIVQRARFALALKLT